MNRHDVAAVLGSSAVGARVGTVVVFMNRPEMPPIVKGPGGMELTHPIYVSKVPLWAYVPAAAGCVPGLYGAKDGEAP